MNFFSGLDVSLCGSFPASTEVVGRTPTFYGIQFNYFGKVFLRIDHGAAMLVDGPCVFISHPGAYFEYGSVNGQPRHHNFICVSGSRIKSYIDSGLLDISRESPLVKIPQPEKFLQTMLSLKSLVEHSAALPPRAVMLFEDLLLQIYEARMSAKKLPLYQHRQLNALIEKIRKDPAADHDFAAAAQQCSVTQIHFRRLFKIETGLPPLQFLLTCRLQYAAQLLISTEMPMTEIAETVNIANPFYFSRLFKNRYKISPLAYRKEYTGK